MPVVVDTSIWAQYYRVVDSSEALAVRQLIATGEVVMVGIVYAELLQGARDDEQSRSLKDGLDALPFVEMTKESWARSGRILAELRRMGMIIPLPDAVIASVALEHSFEIFSRDEHFQRIPGLQFFSPLSS